MNSWRVERLSSPNDTWYTVDSFRNETDAMDEYKKVKTYCKTAVRVIHIAAIYNPDTNYERIHNPREI